MTDTLSLTFDNTPGSVTLPITGTGVAVSIYWGDSTTTTSLSHTYSGPGPFTAVVTITAGTVTKFGSSSGWTGVGKLTAIATTNTSTWGLGSSVTDLSYLCYDALLLTSVPSNIPSSVINLEGMFLGAILFNQNISNWDVSNVTNMGEMFAAATTFNQYIRTWAVQPTTTLADMFNGASAFQTAFYPTIPGYNTSGNTPSYTFFNVPLALTFGNTPGSVTLPITGTGVAVSVDWGDGSPLGTSLSHTYSGTGPFTASITIDPSSIVTTFGAIGWPGVDRLVSVATSNPTTWGFGSSLTSLAHLFDVAFGLTSVPTNIPPSVTNLSGLFINASIFNQDISSWDVSNITFMDEMFAGATSFNQDISSWDVSSVQNTSNMFASATAFNNGSLTDDEAHPLTDWDTGSVIIMSGMFASASSFNQDIGSWDTTSTILMEGMFYGATIFNQDIGGWDISHVVNTKLMFYSATNFNGNISGWDVSSVATMDRMFQNDTSFNRNIREWAVQSGTNLSNMFNGATAFQTAFYTTTPGYDTDPNTPLYTFFNYTPPPPPPPPQPTPVLRLPVGGGGGSFWFGPYGFLFKAKGGGGARRSTKMAPGGNTTCNGPTYIYNKFKPGGGGVGASSIANRRAKNRLATICNTQKCFPCFPTLGQYSNYTHNPNGYVPCPPRSINM